MAGFRETKKKSRQGRIYKAAIELLSEKGYSNTHMRDISERAQLAVGTLYNYYSSKSDLYMEVMEEKWFEISSSHARRIVHLVCTEKDLFTVLKGIIFPVFDDMFEIGMQDWGELFMAMFSSKNYMDRGARMDLEAIEQFGALLGKLQKRGLIQKSVDPMAAAASVYSVIAFNVLAFLFIEGMSKEYLYLSIEQQLRLLIDGFGSSTQREVRDD